MAYDNIILYHLRNIIKEYAPDSYYHVYTRGVSKQKVFLEKDTIIL